MDPLKALVDEYLSHAQAAYDAENFQAAYKLCLKVLEIVPDDENVLSLKRKIEDAVENYNIHLIDKQIDSLQHLWKEERYQEIVNALQELYKVAPHYGRLEKLLAEAEEKFRDQMGNKMKDSLKNYENELDQLFSQGFYTEAIEKINATEKIHPKEEKLRKIHLSIKDRIIGKKLKEKETLMNSDKYEEIVNFLYRLNYLHPSSKKVQKFLRKYRKELLNSQLEGKRDFIFRSKENIKNLILLEKYEFAIEACEDLLKIDPRNLFAKKTILSSEAKLKRFLREAMYQQITEQTEELKKEYGEHAQNFIRI